MEEKVILTTESVSKFFGALGAVNNVDFKVKSNQIRGLIGPNGAGKTTLFNLITGHLKLSSGKIFFRGEDITNRPARSIVSKGIARTFQITNIFENLSANENVLLGGLRTVGDHRDFWSKKKRMNINEYNFLEEIFELIKLEKPKREEKASSLSYPDQRLLEIGIALASAPKLLLLDEPLAGLGAESVEDIKKAIRKVSRQTDVVVIDHNLDAVVELSDKITVMHNGEILFEGSPEEVKANKDVEKIYLKG